MIIMYIHVHSLVHSIYIGIGLFTLVTGNTASNGGLQA